MSSFQRVLCTGFNGVEDVSLLERCPHFRGCCTGFNGVEDVSLLERCPHFRGRASMELGPEDREVSSFQRVLC